MKFALTRELIHARLRYVAKLKKNWLHVQYDTTMHFVFYNTQIREVK